MRLLRFHLANYVDVVALVNPEHIAWLSPISAQSNCATEIRFAGAGDDNGILVRESLNEVVRAIAATEVPHGD